MHGRNRSRRLLPTLALSALVVTLALPAQARPASRPAAPVPHTAGWSAEARAFLSHLWQGGSQGFRGLFGAEGASLDPNGVAPTGSGAGVGAGSGVVVTPGHGV